MVGAAVRSYMLLARPRMRLEEASARVDGAYLMYRMALKQLGTRPADGRDRAILEARADAIAAAVEHFSLAVSEVALALSGAERRPPF